MKALVLRHDVEDSVACAKALMQKGFQVACVETCYIARAMMQIETIDLLMLDESIDGRLTHPLALSAERQNPYITSILMTDRPAEDTDDLFALIPSVYALAGLRTAPEVLAKLAVASLENYQELAARVSTRLAVEEAENAEADSLEWTDAIEWEDVEDAPQGAADAAAVVVDAAPVPAQIAAEPAAELAAPAQDDFAAARAKHDLYLLTQAAFSTEVVDNVESDADTDADIPLHLDAVAATPALADPDLPQDDADETEVETALEQDRDRILLSDRSLRSTWHLHAERARTSGQSRAS